MIDPTQTIVSILRQHIARLKAPIVGSSRLSDLGIDVMDLPIVILDLEDAFQICIPFDEYERLETVRELSACVVQVAKKSIQEARKLASSPRVRPNWTSTLAHR